VTSLVVGAAIATDGADAGAGRRLSTSSSAGTPYIGEGVDVDGRDTYRRRERRHRDHHLAGALAGAWKAPESVSGWTSRY
jgi:hypothetical protein